MTVNSPTPRLIPVLSFREVGAIMGIDSRRVWYIEQQAFKKLRKKLGHLFQEDEVAS